MAAINKFISDGCKVRIQKGFPFVDNIIQLYIPENITGPNPHIKQVDFYIYQPEGKYAYMRWFNSPSGLHGKKLKNHFFKIKRILFPPKQTTGKMKYLNIIIPKRIRYFYFILLFHLYYKLGKCIYHVQPIKYFKNLKTIQFYDIAYKIANETENYLMHRYGPNWKTPDADFNTDFYKEKWKMVSARQELKFSLLDKPTIDFDLQANYIEYLPDHMNETP